MRKITVNVSFRISDEVFRKCDPDKFLYIVTGYYIDNQGVMYKINGISGTFTVYSYEIDFFTERLAILN
jgi:hypothetical protein